MKHIVALSGGHDSTALAIRLKEVEPRDYTYVCTPTGNELLPMFEHWNNLSEILGSRIIPITGEFMFKALLRNEKALPNFRMRFCTRKLKIEPYRLYITTQTPCTSYVGLRADEEGRAGGSYSDIDGVIMRFPLRDWGWTEDDVQNYLLEKNITVPRRTDCALCYHQRLIEWYWLYKDHPEEWKIGEQLEEELQATFRSPGRDTWPIAMKDLRAEFEKGRIPKNTFETSRRNIGECRVCTL